MYILYVYNIYLISEKHLPKQWFLKSYILTDCLNSFNCIWRPWVLSSSFFTSFRFRFSSVTSKRSERRSTSAACSQGAGPFSGIFRALKHREHVLPFILGLCFPFACAKCPLVRCDLEGFGIFTETK